MKRLFYIIMLLVVAVACEKEIAFTCRVIEHDVEKITETSATLTATVFASNYDAIDRIGFVVSVNGKDEVYPTNIGRMIEVELTELNPATTYEYDIIIYANGDSWVLEGDKFKTLNTQDEPEPTPDPEPDPTPEPEPDPTPEPEPDPTLRPLS